MPSNGAGIPESLWKALDEFRVELPSWGFANTRNALW